MSAPARCSECGDLIPIPADLPGGPVCDRCLHPRPPSVGNGHQGHYDDDPSGPSGSWDRAVRLYEEPEA